ncbi:MAG: SGNH/GDSL hydrolase family protein [Phycisphaerae bacterium]
MRMNVFNGSNTISATGFGISSWRLVVIALLVLAMGRTLHAASRQFYLKNGDRVLFYGDSITAQGFYPADVELYVRTRFPNLHVRFINSGYSGDSVTGGGAGTINLRLKRDVFPFKPNIVTIMLGMNDARYAPFNQKDFKTFKVGYTHIIRSLRKHLPGVKIVVIEPSPWDDVTHKPFFMWDPKYHGPGSYNDVLIRYGQFVRQLAIKYHLMCVNFNRPLVNVLRRANRMNHALATQIIPGRIHPDANGQLVMAETLLKAWNAPATVTAVQINAAKNSVFQADNTRVSGLTVTHGIVSWSQMDRALPMALMDLHGNWPQFPPMLTWTLSADKLWETPKPNWNYVNVVTALVAKLSHLYSTLDQEPLMVTGLSAGRYTLKIDDRVIGTFTSGQLSTGINLACYHTPMLAQSYRVMAAIWHEQQTRFYILRDVQVPLQKYGPYTLDRKKSVLVRALYHHLFHHVDAQSYAAARLQPHRYELIPMGN